MDGWLFSFLQGCRGPQQSLTSTHLHRFCKHVTNGDVVSWNSIIAGYTARGDSAAAVILFEKMQHQGVHPDDVTYSWILKAYTSEGEHKEGRVLHDEIIRRGFESNKSIASSLVELYALYGAPDDGKKIFDDIDEKDLILWNALVAAYAQAGRCLCALNLFERLVISKVVPDGFTFSSVIKVCGDIRDRVNGQIVHNQILKSDSDCDLETGNALVDMYRRFGNMEEAYSVFETLSKKDVVTWNTLISGFIEEGGSCLVLDLFGRMQMENLKPDEVTYTCVLKACTSIGAGMEGRLVHDQVLRHGLEQCVSVKNLLVDFQEGYKDFGELLSDWAPWDGKVVEHILQEPILQESGIVAQDGFSDMTAQREKFSYVTLLKACSSCGATSQGMVLHDQIIRHGCEFDIVVGSSLLSLYANCGSVREARTIFDMLPNRDVAAWNAIISGYGQHGDYLAANSCLESMRDHGLMPDVRTFCSMLAACSRSGKAELVNWYLHWMQSSGILPDFRHVTCIIDLLSRDGKLYQAETLLKSSPFSPDLPEWRALLSACRAHGDKAIGGKCHNEILLSEPESFGGYVPMSSIGNAPYSLSSAEPFNKQQIAVTCQSQVERLTCGMNE